MALSNCRPLRFVSSTIELVRHHYQQFEGRRGGNIAFFRIECRRGIGPRTTRLRGGTVGGETAVIYDNAANRYVIFARNAGMGGAHSEQRCIQLFNEYFNTAADPYDTVITYVFTEREPCHDAHPNCLALLTQLLETAGWGREGAATPVRYLRGYASADELFTMARIDGIDVAAARQANRRDGQLGAKQIRERDY
ncbi:MAG: hypothetical protein JWM41_462 [Gemmatimonadetes bacterium]|nr:hypothetical protein [Gemmatimonadota bacterium]